MPQQPSAVCPERCRYGVQAVTGATSLLSLVLFALPASAQFEQRPPAAPPSSVNPPAASAGAARAAARPSSIPYQMKPEDLTLDCAKLTGRIGVRLRQVRAALSDPQTTQLSRSLQAVTVPIIGGTERGIDPRGDIARELGLIEAYNARLVEKKCPAFDLDADLAPGNTSQPRPVRPAKAPQAKPSQSAGTSAR